MKIHAQSSVFDGPGNSFDTDDISNSYLDAIAALLANDNGSPVVTVHVERANGSVTRYTKRAEQ